ncbi:MAG: flavodoxin family protein [Ruminococcaceae bacterium]|nr:flavodoxin family protein [Oscillospiraceae bacterium]
MSKILIISTSLRSGSNSDILAQAFSGGAKSVGHDVETVSLRGKNLSFCRGCLACQKLGHCVIDDDANGITDKMEQADVIVWATPIYYYEMSGQMKTMIDRANPLYSRDYKFKKVYLLATATENESYVPEGAMKGVQGWVDCFDGVEFVKTLFVGGVTSPKEIEGNENLSKAYALGASV